MKRGLLSWAGVLALTVAAGTAGAQGFDHSAWDRVLKQHVNEAGFVDYAALKASPAELDRYVAQIAARSPVSHAQDFPSRESQLAYWINVYNALTIHCVVQAWPTKSVRDIGFLFGFFRRKQFTVGGREMTLDNIEHDTLRPIFREPRIHFAINCASVSCPRLQREAYTADNVDRLLDEAAHSFVNEKRNFQIDAQRNRVTVAKIFDWFGGDFRDFARDKKLSGTGHPILDYIRPYLNDANRAALARLRNPRVGFFDYDWSVNDVKATVPRD